MSATLIKCLNEAREVEQLKEIFFESSTKKKFTDAADKEAFYWKYAGYYLIHYPELVFIAMRDQKMLGYCLGGPTAPDLKLVLLQPHLKTFTDLYSEYPAHLHINCHADARGHGIGSSLLLHFEKQMQERGIIGLHLITSSNARNRSFYSRLGYSFEAERDSLLLMGKKL